MTMNQQRWQAVMRRVRSLVRRRVAAADVEDVTQEALLRIHRGLPGVRADAALLGWVNSVVRGAIADHHHRAVRPGAELAEAAATPEEPSVLAVVTPFVEAFIDLLPEPYREAVRLTDLSDQRQADVARALGLAPATLKSRVQRGRAMLRAELERCCEFEIDGLLVGDIRPRAHIKPRR